MDEKAVDQTGYARPPRAHQFKKGVSGNPRGRPRSRKLSIPYDHVLGRMVTVREDGRERRVTAAEAFMLQLTKKGLEGDSAAARSSLETIEAARAKHSAAEGIEVLRVVLIGIGPGAVLTDLKMAVKRFPLSKQKVRLELEPWIVQAAIDRFGDRRLSEAEQREVWQVVRRPENVVWPEWWVAKG